MEEVDAADNYLQVGGCCPGASGGDAVDVDEHMGQGGQLLASERELGFWGCAAVYGLLPLNE